MMISAENTSSRGSLDTLVDRVQSEGRYTFTADEVEASVPLTTKGRESAVRGLVASGRIVRPLPRHGFYVVVPPEFRTMGAPPLAWYIDPMMRFLGEHDYYVGLLTAAEWQGASHYAVQVAQIVVTGRIRPMKVGRERITFVTDENASFAAVEERMTEAGPVRVSTPEATALDLVRHLARIGDMAILATAISELPLTPKGIVKALYDTAEVTAVQRLGYLLEKAGKVREAAVAERWLSERPYRVRSLDPRSATSAGEIVVPPWKIRVNAYVEMSA
jgi:hypothetical protein